MMTRMFVGYVIVLAVATSVFLHSSVYSKELKHEAKIAKPLFDGNDGSGAPLKLLESYRKYYHNKNSDIRKRYFSQTESWQGLDRYLEFRWFRVSRHDNAQFIAHRHDQLGTLPYELTWESPPRVGEKSFLVANQLLLFVHGRYFVRIRCNPAADDPSYLVGVANHFLELIDRKENDDGDEDRDDCP